MKNIFLTITIAIFGSSLMAQTTNMIIRTTDGNTHSYPITEIDSVYYQEGSVDGPGAGLSDYDGNNYTSIIIGGKEWMAENLKVTHYPNGDLIPLVTDNTAWGNLAANNTEDAYTYYNNNANGEADTYGSLYTYAAAIGDNWARDNTANQGVCPDGWHLPTDVEWLELETYLGTNAGSKLAGYATLWSDGNLDQSIDFGTSGFSALPSGIRDNNGTFYFFGVNSFWWSASENDSSSATNRYLDFNNTTVYSNNYDKSNGFSVRCLKN